jgi:hypothetical protein
MNLVETVLAAIDDADGTIQRVPTDPMIRLEAVPGEERQVRLRATLPDDHARTFPLGIYGPNPDDERSPAPRTAIDRIITLADFTTEELLEEINGRVAAMQRQWQDSLDLAARYARIAQIVGGQ